jgi:hypothetical protein
MDEPEPDSSRGFQMSLTETWLKWDGPDPDGRDWQPVWRNGGPRAGERLGTAHYDGDNGWTISMGVDEHGEALPEFGAPS